MLGNPRRTGRAGSCQAVRGRREEGGGEGGRREGVREQLDSRNSGKVQCFPGKVNLMKLNLQDRFT